MNKPGTMITKEGTVKQLRECVTGYVKELDALTKDETVKAAIAKWLETYEDLDASTPATEALVALLENGKFSAEEQAIVDEINDTPMKVLDWETPNEVWYRELGKVLSKTSHPKTGVALTN